MDNFIDCKNYKRPLFKYSFLFLHLKRGHIFTCLSWWCFQCLHVFAHVFKRVFFQSGYLRLADGNFLGHFHLGLSLKETHRKNISFPGGKLFHRFRQGDILNPLSVCILHVFDLIHHIDRIAVIVKNRFEIVKSDPGWNPTPTRYLPASYPVAWAISVIVRLPLQQTLASFSFACSALYAVSRKRTGYTDTIVIPKIPPHFPDNHWHRIGAEFYAMGCVEIIQGFNQSDASHLEQIIRDFLPDC